MKPKKQSLLNREEESELLKNISSDPDDDVSLRLLQLHYQEMDKFDQKTQQKSYY